MPYAELFTWWIATIAWSIAFPIAVSAYLYHRRKRRGPDQPRRRLQWVADFTFVWFLLGLLAFYVLAVGRGSPLLFALGNLVVEALLLVYALWAGRAGDKGRG